MSKHLHRRGDSFQYRRVFPADVRATAGRRELTKSLKVKTLKEAELEAALWDVEFDKIVATARGIGQPSEATAIVLATRLLQSKGLLTAEGAVNFPQIDPRKPEHNTIQKQLRVIEEWEAKYEAAYDQLALSVASMTPDGEGIDTYDPANPHSQAYFQLIGQKAPKLDYTLHDAAVLYVETNRRKVGRKADQQAKSEQQQWLRLNELADWLGEGNRDRGYKTPFKSIDAYSFVQARSQRQQVGSQVDNDAQAPGWSDKSAEKLSTNQKVAPLRARSHTNRLNQIRMLPFQCHRE